jgi:peptidyl-dipeptidase A
MGAGKGGGGMEGQATDMGGTSDMSDMSDMGELGDMGGAGDMGDMGGSDTSRRPGLSPEAKAEAQKKADAFLASYFRDLARLEKEENLSYWKAANSGAKADFDASAKARLEQKKLHSDPRRYEELKALLAQGEALAPLTRRSLEVAELAFKGNQLPADLLKKMVDAATDIERIFSTHRGKVGGKAYSNNELLEMLRKEKAHAKRQAAWEATKQVGAEVGPKLVALAKVRNEAAKKLGFADYWDMSVRLQEHDPTELLRIFAELEKLTDAPFTAMKAKMDAELAARFGTKVEELMPWHYDNPFFQAAPPSAKLDLDELYKGKKKEDVVAMASKFYTDIGIDTAAILGRSDLYERKGKDQHAFCIAIDREGDVRVLTNVKPTAEWMDTMLHELGHAVYYQLLDFSLPFNLRESAHIFTTEAVAMLFGALAKNPTWISSYVGADQKKVEAMAPEIYEQRRREQLIFARWALVMLHFEKALYANPDEDLNKLWWDQVERFQRLKRPPGRNLPDWAAKPHFTIAPVYYHNYLLGEVFAAQLRFTLAKAAKHQGTPQTLEWAGRKQLGELMTRKVFKPGMRLKWPAFVKEATGEALSARHFAAEVR